MAITSLNSNPHSDPHGETNGPTIQSLHPDQCREIASRLWKNVHAIHVHEGWQHAIQSDLELLAKLAPAYSKAIMLLSALLQNGFPKYGVARSLFAANCCLQCGCFSLFPLLLGVTCPDRDSFTDVQQSCWLPEHIQSYDDVSDVDAQLLAMQNQGLPLIEVEGSISPLSKKGSVSPPGTKKNSMLEGKTVLNSAKSNTSSTATSAVLLHQAPNQNLSSTASQTQASSSPSIPPTTPGKNQHACSLEHIEKFKVLNSEFQRELSEIAVNLKEFRKTPSVLKSSTSGSSASSKSQSSRSSSHSVWAGDMRSPASRKRSPISRSPISKPYHPFKSKAVTLANRRYRQTENRVSKRTDMAPMKARRRTTLQQIHTQSQVNEELPEGYYAVDQLLEFKAASGRKPAQWQVAWKNYPVSQASWEGARELKRDMGAAKWREFVSEYHIRTRRAVGPCTVTKNVLLNGDFDSLGSQPGTNNTSASTRHTARGDIIDVADRIIENGNRNYQCLSCTRRFTHGPAFVIHKRACKRQCAAI